MSELTADQKEALKLAGAGPAKFDLRFDERASLMKAMDELVGMGMVKDEEDDLGYTVEYTLTDAGKTRLEELNKEA